MSKIKIKNIYTFDCQHVLDLHFRARSCGLNFFPVLEKASQVPDAHHIYFGIATAHDFNVIS
jgi:hypothetical protein